MAHTLRFLLLLSVMVSWSAGAQTCPGSEDEAPIKVPIQNGPTVIVCGFEDNDVPTPKGKRAFSELSLYFVNSKSKDPQKIFAGELSDTYWVKVIDRKKLEVEELWFFTETPQAALKRDITCTKDECVASAPKCIFKLKPNSFPKALGEFESRQKSGQMGDDGEELLDQIWAQALTGDKAAIKFYETKPAGLDPALNEAFVTNQAKLQELKNIKCR